MVRRVKGRGARSLPSADSLPRPWLQAYPAGVPPTYDYPDVPVTRFLDDAARDFPGVAATVFGGATLSYADVLDQVDRLAAALDERDVGPGTRVALALPPIPAAPIALFAVLRLGAVVVPLRHDLHEDHLSRRLADTGSQLVVCMTADVPRLNTVRAHLPRLRHVIATSPEEWLPLRRRVAARLRVRRRGAHRRLAPEDEASSLRDVIDRSDPLTPLTHVSSAQPALTVCDEASDGEEIVLSHAHLVAASFQARLWIPDTQAGRERVLVADGMADAPGLTVSILAPTLSAATLLMVGAPSPDDVLRAIERTKPTLMPCAGETCDGIAEASEAARRDITSIRVGLVGPLLPHPEAIATVERLSEARLREFYGRGEAPFTHANPVYGRALRGGIGLPVTDTVAVVVDPADPRRVMPTGEVGSLAISGPQVASDDGWLVTDDPATMDEDGYFRLASKASP